jgi:hypothetical protein
VIDLDVEGIVAARITSKSGGVGEVRTRDCASRFWFVLDIVDLLAGIRSPLSNGNCAIGFANDAHTRCRCLHIIREVRYFASRLTNNRE